MNILYNQPITEKELQLFKLIEEFVYTNLEDKSLFYRITVKLYEDWSKKGALLRPTGKYHMYQSKYKTRIDINSYILKIISDSFIRHNNPIYKDFEQVRYETIFHEFAHLVTSYNDPEKTRLALMPNTLVLDYDDEKLANKLARDFLGFKGIINYKGVDGNAV